MRCQFRLVSLAVLVSTCVLCALSLQAQDNSDEAKVRGLRRNGLTHTSTAKLSCCRPCWLRTS